MLCINMVIQKILLMTFGIYISLVIRFSGEIKSAQITCFHTGYDVSPREVYVNLSPFRHTEVNDFCVH